MKRKLSGEQGTVRMRSCMIFGKTNHEHSVTLDTFGEYTNGCKVKPNEKEVLIILGTFLILMGPHKLISLYISLIILKCYDQLIYRYKYINRGDLQVCFAYILVQ